VTASNNPALADSYKSSTYSFTNDDKPVWRGVLGNIQIIAKEIIKMGLLEDMDKRVKKFGIIDVKLAQGAAMFVALIVAKLIPQIMDLSIWWFVGLLIICAIKPFNVFWFKE
jgi:hypothetical protein